MIVGAGMRGCEAANYLHEPSACKDQELEAGGGGGGRLKPLVPPPLRH